MLKLGAVLLSLWSGLNLLLAIGIVLAMTLFGANAPALSLKFSGAEIQALDTTVLGVVNALAVLCNACIAAFCALVLMLTWRQLIRGSRWALLVVAATTTFVQATGFLSDRYLGNQNLLPNLVSTIVLVAGLGLCASALQSIPDPERL